jgi:hypothetical protein
MTDHDTELVALIDNELDGDAKARLLARLVQDEAMRDVRSQQVVQPAWPEEAEVAALTPNLSPT